MSSAGTTASNCALAREWLAVRIIVFGASPDDARFVTEQLAREAFHNVSFFAGTWAELQEATGSMASK